MRGKATGGEICIRYRCLVLQMRERVRNLSSHATDCAVAIVCLKLWLFCRHANEHYAAPLYELAEQVQAWNECSNVVMRLQPGIIPPHSAAVPRRDGLNRCR